MSVAATKHTHMNRHMNQSASTVRGRRRRKPHLCHKLWRTASGDLRLFWLLRSRTAPEARPEPPCLLLRLPLWHHHRQHHLLLLPLPLLPSSRCCPCQHQHRHPSLAQRCTGWEKKPQHDCQTQPLHHRDGEQQAGPVPLTGTCSADERCKTLRLYSTCRRCRCCHFPYDSANAPVNLSNI